MLQPPLQLLGPSQTPPSSPFIDLESQLPETPAQTSLTLNQEISQIPETQPLHFTAINSEILLQLAQIQAPQPHSAMETELLHLQPPTQQTPSLDISTQQINMVIVKQLISKKFPDISKALEKVAIFLATFAFFTAIATPLALTLN
ncbi:hypothetical protein H0E87_008938 [Populus deltoides]|uniref:Uncharacterized protein n=1 Tax=Populus deltoides TaxID=3696 RepID=A0A8T2Z2U2_POPDE|nr:hypothetical protein H0E87_008863 [Populus deltoides]KAH8511453.1 hypothetical protein H0E87_008864 [Populus deltoides]KAH8511562.1 hypothetical protein H0E87_008938 [Populus deltoides]